MKQNLLDRLLAVNTNPQTHTCIELITCQWINPKDHVLDSRLCLDIKDLAKLTEDDLLGYFEVGHLIRELINWTIVAFNRSRIEPGVSTEDLIDGDHWPEFTSSDEAEVLSVFKFDSLDDLIETLREHMGLLEFLNDADSIGDLEHDLAKLSSSLVFRDYVEAGHKVKDSPRFSYFINSWRKSDFFTTEPLDPESLKANFSLDIFKPYDCEGDWVRLALNRGILVSG